MKDFKIIIFIGLIILVSVNLLTGQPVNNIQQFNSWQIKGFAKKAQKQGDIYSAIDYYEYFAKMKPDNLKIAFKLAELYRSARDYKKAEKYYSKVYSVDPQKWVLALYYEAQMLKMSGEYEKAKEKFTKFKKEYKGDDVSFKRMVKIDIEGCDLAKTLMDSSLSVIITHLDTSINKAHIELSPLLLVDNKTLLYASLKADSVQYYDIDKKDIKLPIRNFYTAKKINDKWIGGGKFEGPFNDTLLNTGNGAFSPDGYRFYFTRCFKDSKYKVICSIYLSKKEGLDWSEPIKLDNTINDPKFTSTQPTIGTDSKDNEVLYFVSDRINGKGGLDIWYSIYDSKKGVFKEPRNCGRSVNTTGDEITPFFDNKNHTLYFSSNGRPNIGGFDIFKTVGELGKWLDPENIGYPVNSSFDDMYYTMSNKNEGFFVSNRKESIVLESSISDNVSIVSDDIYSYLYNKYIYLAVTGKIFEIRDSSIYKLLENPNKNVDEMDTSKSIQLAKGQKISLYLIDKKTKQAILIKKDSTNENGEYLFDLERGNNYKLVPENMGLTNKQLTFTTKNMVTSDTIYMKPIYVNVMAKEPIVVKNIYYEFGAYKLSDKAKNIIDSTLLVLLLKAPQIIVEISSHTDSIGKIEYNMNLSQKRAEGVVDYLISKGIEKERLIPKGYGATNPIALNTNPDGTDNPQGRDKNRRTEFKIIGSLEEQINYEE